MTWSTWCLELTPCQIGWYLCYCGCCQGCMCLLWYYQWLTNSCYGWTERLAPGISQGRKARKQRPTLQSCQFYLLEIAEFTRNIHLLVFSGRPCHYLQPYHIQKPQSQDPRSGTPRPHFGILEAQAQWPWYGRRNGDDCNKERMS